MKRISYNRYIDGKLPPGTKLVTRPSKYGNPFLVSEYGREKAVQLFEKYIDEKIDEGFDLSELKGFNLACICDLDQLCHADILLKKLENIE
jgi:hypothetical protein